MAREILVRYDPDGFAELPVAEDRFLRAARRDVLSSRSAPDFDTAQLVIAVARRNDVCPDLLASIEPSNADENENVRGQQLATPKWLKPKPPPVEFSGESSATTLSQPFGTHSAGYVHKRQLRDAFRRMN